MKQLVAQNKKDFDTWYKCLNRFNEFLCDHQVSKSDLIEFLSILDHFRPKVIEKQILPDSLTQVGSQTSISEKHEEEYFRIRTPRDPLIRIASFLKKHVSDNMNKIMKLDLKKNFENREKECMKNCTSKYMQQLDILYGFKDSYISYYGINIFLNDKKHEEAMKKLAQLMKSYVPE